MLTRDSQKVQEKINAVTAGFAGGTRIAASIADFIDIHAKHRLAKSARLIVLSDGFDSDPPARLAEELGRVRRRGARIYWLHPTREGSRSEALAASRDRIDAFLPVHNLESLARLREVIT